MTNSEFLPTSNPNVVLARRNFADYVRYTLPRYSMQPFQAEICLKLDLFERGEVKKLMVFMPPQHGKSELTTRNFPAFLLGKDPERKIVVASYSATIASSFNRDIQRKIDTELYHDVFPETRLNDSNVVTVANGSALRNSEIFETVGYGGFVKTVGRGGALTGTPVDIGIIDDPLKDRAEAQSLTIRESLWSWYTDVFETRLHNGSQQLLIQTRWHEDDLAGRLLDRDDDWTVILFPAIFEGALNDYDHREVGEALWPERHSLEKLERIRDHSPVTFNSLYQQDPKPSTEALIFPDWQMCDTFPDDCKYVVYGLDFGFTNDPTALIKIGITNDRVYLDEIIYEHGLSNRDIAQIALARGVSINDLIVADSAEPKSIDDLKRGYREAGIPGLNVKPAQKGPGSVNVRIDYFKRYRVFYTKRSRNLHREKNSYQWIMNGNVATNKPQPGNDHGMDAAGYGIEYAVRMTNTAKPKAKLPYTGHQRFDDPNIKLLK